MTYLSFALAVTALVFSVFATLVAVAIGLRMEQDRRLRSGLQKEQGLAIGTAIPVEALKPLEGSLSIGTSEALVVFVSSDCPGCVKFIDEANRIELDRAIPILMVETSNDAQSLLRQSATFQASWVTDSDGALQKAFATQVTPHAFRIRHGRVARKVIGPALSELMEPLASAETLHPVAV